MRRELPMILIRVIVGFIFLIEGILKFAHPEEMGAGVFASLGLPFLTQLTPTLGIVEIVSGAAILFNLYAGDASLLVLVVMLLSLATSKLPILFGHAFWHFPFPVLPHYGWLSFFHEARAELFMIFGSLAVLIDSGLHIGRRRPWYQSRDL